MEKQALSQVGPLWASYGFVLLVMFTGVAVAAIKDSRLAQAAAKTKPE
jgi:hypothetical protein